MFLPCSRLDGRNDLPGDAQFGKGPEGRQFITAKIPRRLIQADHAFLDDVIPIGTDEKIGASL